MDWALAIELNRTALLRLLAGLFAMAGLERGGSVAFLPRHVRAVILFVLRPAESATRRLVIVSAREIVVAVREALSARTGSGARGAAERTACLALIDPRKRFGMRRPPSVPPRIFFFDGSDQKPVEKRAPSPDDLIDAARLCRRLHALVAALEDLPKQAFRLVRMRARKLPSGKLRKEPMRANWPPGYRKRVSHEVDTILRDCHALATMPPDTS